MTLEAQDAPPMGHNNPPPDTPYEAFKAHIEDLVFEARNWLDGEPIQTEEQAAAVSRILDDARRVGKDADTQRKVEAKPFDDGKAAVQARWKPVIEKADLAATTAKQALAPYLQAIEEQQRKEAEALNAEARRLAAIAVDAHRKASGNLEAQEDAERLLSAAVATKKEAAKAAKQKAHATGGERAIGLRSVWSPTLTDPCAALKHYRERQPEALKSWLVEQAEKDVRAGARSIPGFEVTEARVAV